LRREADEFRTCSGVFCISVKTVSAGLEFFVSFLGNAKKKEKIKKENIAFLLPPYSIVTSWLKYG